MHCLRTVINAHLESARLFDHSEFLNKYRPSNFCLCHFIRNTIQHFLMSYGLMSRSFIIHCAQKIWIKYNMEQGPLIQIRAPVRVYLWNWGWSLHSIPGNYVNQKKTEWHFPFPKILCSSFVLPIIFGKYRHWWVILQTILMTLLSWVVAAR